MKDRQFDETLRRRIDTEVLTMNPRSEQRIAHAMRNPNRKMPARRAPMRVLLVAALVVLLLFGVAIAAVTWNSRAFLTRPEEDGTASVNEALLGYVQPVGAQYVSGRLQMDVIDAIFDGNALVMTWTMTNTGNDPLYLLCDILLNGDYAGQGRFTRVDELFLQPGETIESGLDVRTGVEYASGGADSCDVAMQYTAFAYTGEIVDIPGFDDYVAEEDQEAYWNERHRWIDAQVALGNIVVSPDGVIELGSNAPYEEGMTRADRLAASGLMTKADTLNVKLPIPRNAETVSATSDEGPIEKDNGAYILRVTRADLTPNTVTIELERVFKTKADVEAFSAYYDYSGETPAAFWEYSVVDETGDIWWASNSGGSATTDMPAEREDGSWVWGYQFTAVGIVRPPKTLTIVPRRGDLAAGDALVEYPEEGLTISFE